MTITNQKKKIYRTTEWTTPQLWAGEEKERIRTLRMKSKIMKKKIIFGKKLDTENLTYKYRARWCACVCMLHLVFGIWTTPTSSIFDKIHFFFLPFFYRTQKQTHLPLQPHMENRMLLHIHNIYACVLFYCALNA